MIKYLLLPLLLFIFSVVAQANSLCLIDASFENNPIKVKVSHIIDGDTFVITGGTKIRIVGINTPEMARFDYKGNIIKKEERFSQEAKQKLEELMSNGQVTIYPSNSKKDRYGRTLAHVFVNQKNITKGLILNGLGWAVTISPDDMLSSCYWQADKKARDSKRGIWSDNGIKPIAAINFSNLGSSGFNLVTGVISRVKIKKGHIKITIDDEMIISIGSRYSNLFTNKAFAIGDMLEVRGWVIDLKKKSKRLAPGRKRWLISINHPLMINILEP